jgi:hypothetical protein
MITLIIRLIECRQRWWYVSGNYKNNDDDNNSSWNS